MIDARRQDQLSRYGPWVTFVATVVLAAVLSRPGRGPATIVGFAEGEALSISPTEPARVATVAVEAGQEVRVGQIVATMNTSAVDAELAIAEAKNAELTARVAAGSAGLAQNELSKLHVFDATVERARRALAQEEDAEREATAELDAVERERRRILSLLRDGLATREELARVELKYSALKQKAVNAPETLRLLSEQLRDAIARRDRYARGDDPELAVEPLRLQIEVLQRRIEALRKRRED